MVIYSYKFIVYLRFCSSCSCSVNGQPTSNLFLKKLTINNFIKWLYLNTTKNIFQEIKKSMKVFFEK